jgi:hypothetical protein
VPDQDEIGRPAVEAVFVAWVLTAVIGLAVAHALAALARAAASSPQGLGLAPQPAVPLTLCVVYVSVAFGFAQAILPGPKSTGCLGLLIPVTGAIALAVRGLDPSAVVGALVAGVFLTPAAYYLAVRLSFPLRGFARRRPLAAALGGAIGAAAVFEAARWLTWMADPATHGRFW